MTIHTRQIAGPWHPSSLGIAHTLGTVHAPLPDAPQCFNIRETKWPGRWLQTSLQSPSPAPLAGTRRPVVIPTEHPIPGRQCRSTGRALRMAAQGCRWPSVSPMVVHRWSPMVDNRWIPMVDNRWIPMVDNRWIRMVEHRWSSQWVNGKGAHPCRSHMARKHNIPKRSMSRQASNICQASSTPRATTCPASLPHNPGRPLSWGPAIASTVTVRRANGREAVIMPGTRRDTKEF